MAYVSQKIKAEIVTEVKKVLKKYNAKATFRVNNHSTLVCTIKSSPYDFNGATWVNHYWIESHFEDHPAKDFLVELRDAMNVLNWNNSDVQSDYFDVGYYISIKIDQNKGE